MSRFIKLTRPARDQQRDPFSHEVEDEELGGEQQAQAAPTGAPVWVQIECLRCFYPRHGDRAGTRLTFNDGGGFAVTETPEQVLAAMSRTIN